MQVRKEKKRRKVVSLKDRFLEQSRIFASFGRLFHTKGDEDLAKVSTGLSQVCTMLAEQTKEESAQPPGRVTDGLIDKGD